MQDRVSHLLLSERWRQAAKWLATGSEASFAIPTEKFQLSVDLMVAAASSQSRTLKRVVLMLDNDSCVAAMQPFMTWLFSATQRNQWPLFFLACDQEKDLNVSDEMITHAIHPLSDSDLREIIHRMMSLSPELSAELVEKTSGNPKIAREAMRDLVRQKALFRVQMGITSRGQWFK